LKAQPKTNSKNRKRIVWLLFFIFIVQTVIIARFAYVQIIMAPKLQQWAKDQWTNDTKIAARRGKILDRNGNPLAVSGNVERVDAFLKDLKAAANSKKKKITEEEVAEKLASVLKIEKSDLLAQFNRKLKDGRPLSSVVIARRIDREVGNKIREMKLPGIVITEDTKRYYPNGNFLSQVLGNTNVDGDGRAGLELKYNDLLKGEPGRFMGETDRYHRELPYSISSYVPPLNGSDLELTIDQSIQYFVEKGLEKAIIDYKAKRVSCIVMNPKTGEILAMANKPDYNPNKPVVGKVSDALKTWRNSTVNDNFEPGSVLKIITASAAIEEEIINGNEKFICRGSYKVGGKIIHCAKRTGHGVQTFEQILQNSCNVGFMMLGEKIGKEKLHKYYDLFGLGKKTNVDLPGEEKGILRNVKNVGKVELATEAFGQGIAVTMMQYVSVLAAVANNGEMVEPHILKRILNTDENGNTSVVKEVNTKQVKQVISETTAKKLRSMMEKVVSIGGGKKAFIAGYHIGGKTGTAQKVIGGHYADGKYISSFAGIAPSNNPELVIFLSVDEPDPSTPAGYYSGSTAAPTAKTILSDIFRYLNIQPDQKDPSLLTIPEVQVPEIRGLKTEEGKKVLQKNTLNYEVQGNGNIIYDISPKPGISVEQNTKVTIYLGVEKNLNPKVSVPDFREKTAVEIKEIASQLGLNISINGEGVGSDQDIEPGTLVNKNSTITILMEVPED
jgi:stage V sporulation protein D (sporulation-specific penicillin-binding protein)